MTTYLVWGKIAYEHIKSPDHLGNFFYARPLSLK